MSVTQAADGNTGQTVKVGFTLAVGQVGASAANEINGHPAIGVHYMILHNQLSCMPILRFGTKIPCRPISKEIEKQTSRRNGCA
jgi:hypothetical protein